MAEKKGFNIKLYAVIAFFGVAAVLALVTVSTFSSKYIAFHPDKLAVAFVSTIAENGDGYNAYKNTIVSKSDKYGDFIRENYINPVVNSDADGKGYSDEVYKGEKTLSDDGSLSGELIEKMYPVYEELIKAYGWDDYDSIFSGYIKELLVIREEIYGDKFFNDEVFFTAFEANVSQYGASLTGTEDVFDENTGVQLSEKSEGKYQKLYGEDYRFIIRADEVKSVDVNEYLKNADEELYASYGIDFTDINEAATVTVTVTEDETALAEIEIKLVKIGMSWYVDNTTTNTESLYFAK